MKIISHPQNILNHEKLITIEEATQSFLKRRGYKKINLPVLSPALIPESYLEVFKTRFRWQKNSQNLFLTPSPELFLKRLLSSGIGNCYYLGKSFRNADPPTSLHSFEFTMLEFYRIGANYLDLAEDVLALLKELAVILNKEPKISYKGNEIFFDKWEKLKVSEAFEKFTGVEEKELFDHDLFLKRAKEKGYGTEGFTYEDIFSQIYTQEVEPHLGMQGYPTLLYDYPLEFAALAKHNPDGKTSQRFEFYIRGIELGDCYTELTDWKEQDLRFKSEQRLRRRQKKLRHPIDKGFIEALKYGLPDCSGIAIGFDRLAMVYADVKSISDLQLITII